MKSDIFVVYDTCNNCENSTLTFFKVKVTDSLLNISPFIEIKIVSCYTLNLPYGMKVEVCGLILICIIS